MYRILIADDEQSIRQGVAALIRRHCPHWEVDASATDGEEALERAKQFLPHVVLADICMPHKNGLELMETLLGILPDVKLLVLSGYDQFDYAVQALRLGVSDYLMKPVDTNKLLSALEHFEREFDAHAKSLEQSRLLYAIGQTRPDLRAFFSAALAGQSLPCLSAELSHYISGKSYCCVLCTGISEDGETLHISLGEHLGSTAHFCLLPGRAVGEQILILWSDEQYEKDSSFFLAISRTLSAVAVQYKREWEIEVHFFIGVIVDAPAKLKYSYARSQEAMGYTFPEYYEAVTAYKDVLESSMLPCKHLSDSLKKEILTAVSCENRTLFPKKCQELFEWFYAECIRDATYIRMCVLSLCYAILWHDQDLGDLSYIEFTNFQAEIMGAQSEEELRTLFESFVRLCWLRRSRETPPQQALISRIDRIVQAHLSDIDFCLDDVAGALYISPNYLRQLFKQASGQTFTEYLTVQRMRHAQILLGGSGLRISDVAELCGYADSRYFSVCFKKFCHMTPSEYQASLREGN